jgi:hypothetical protein
MVADASLRHNEATLAENFVPSLAYAMIGPRIV